MVQDILERKKTNMVIFASIANKENLMPLIENRTPLLFMVAGKTIIDWIYSISEEIGIEEIVLLVDKEEREILEEALLKYMLPSEPIRKMGPFHLHDFNPKKGISRDLSNILINDFLTEESIWLNGNSIFTIAFFEDFIRNAQGKGKFTIVRENENEKESIGIGWFAKRFLENNLSGAKTVDDIYQRVSTKTASAFITMNYEPEKMEYWKIEYLWNLLDANQVLINEIRERIDGVIEEGVTIKGKVVIEEGAKIRAGSYLEGPLIIGKNCDIGPNCYLRKGVSLDEEVKIGNACELKNTIVYKGSHIAHLSYVGDSIIGSNCNFGAGTITGNLRLDDQAVKASINDSVVSTGRRKIGVIMGDNVKTAINTFFMPGVIVGNNSAIGTGVIVSRNLPSNTFIYQEQELQTREWIVKPKQKKDG
ncbi:MAG TPA: DapH/DapD/GlmU-related protein [candidate division Zixibacteria bacterium]|nr:DapH/DapD/GlmU-related protein [candidate division Zixibacteria bacterium]